MSRWVEIRAGRWMLVSDEPKSKGDPGRAPLVRNEHLTARAKRALYLQTGKKFDSESQVRAYLRDNNLRIEEKGEPNDIMRREDKKWLRDTKPGQREKNPLIGFRGYHTLDTRDR